MTNYNQRSRREFLKNSTFALATYQLLQMNLEAQGSGKTILSGATPGVRVWQSGKEDDGSVHAIGNGSIIVYSKGPHFINLFGPPYTSPNLFALELTAKTGQTLRTESRRKPQTATWTHRIQIKGEDVGSLTDCVFGKIPILHRLIDIERHQITLRLTTPHPHHLLPPFSVPALGDTGKAWVVVAPRGSRCSSTPYPAPEETYAIIAVLGPQTRHSQDRDGLNFEFFPGQSEFLVAGGPQLPAAIENLEKCISRSRVEQREETEQDWKDFAAIHTPLGDALPDKLPQRNRVCELIDSTAFLLKTQQSREGAETAGHYWMLGYARDHYGVARAFLRLRHFEAAKAILAFQLRKFALFGKVHTAYGIGVDSIYHQHENDEVEITGYTVLQAAEYLRETADTGFLRELFPMLDYCWKAQSRNLVGNLLGFNGDESYIAGGLLPRTAINDGSADATLLFTKGGEWLIKWARSQNLWSDDYASEQWKLLQEVRKQWRSSFVRNGRLMANAPERARLVSPRFRHGVCEMGPHFIFWTQRTPEGRYLCTEHLGSGSNLPPPKVEAVELPAAALVPHWVGSDLLTLQELELYLNRILSPLRSGPMPVPDRARGFLGYEPGMLLNALTLLGHPAQKPFFEVVLGLVDSTDAWAEHYEKDGTPRGTRYRQWESGANLEALLSAAQRWNG